MQNYRYIAGLIAAPGALLISGAACAQTEPKPPLSPAPPAMAPTQPIPLFQAVCVNGAASLSRKWASATTYPAMPMDAKRALGLAGAPAGAPAPADKDVPNPVFQISGGDEYLIIPAPQSGPAFADACAVVWKGDSLADASKVAPGAPGGPLTLSAAATHGWTVLKSVPAVPADGDKPSQ
ncbi:MAG: hypothetical protein WDN44_09925 [Sphingomonas sp.]